MIDVFLRVSVRQLEEKKGLRKGVKVDRT